MGTRDVGSIDGITVGCTDGPAVGVEVGSVLDGVLVDLFVGTALEGRTVVDPVCEFWLGVTVGRIVDECAGNNDR